MKKYFLYLYFLVSCVALFFIYYPAREGRFVHDFIWATYYYDHFTWDDIFLCKFDVSYHPFYHLFFYISYQILQTHASRWLLLLAILNAGVIILSFAVFKKLLEQAKVSHAFGIALVGSLLALLSPFMPETVLWGATIHYPISVAAIFITWLLLIEYLETTLPKYLWLSYFTFFLAIYSLEFGVILPFIIAIYLWLWTKPVKVNIRRALTIILPQFFIIFSYFTMNRIVKGNWVGHYGAAVHLNLAPAYMASQFACYLLKYVGLIHFSQFAARNAAYSFVQQKTVGYLLVLCLYLVPLLLFIINYKKNTIVLKTGLILYSFACFALLPTQNMYFMYLFQSENDRLGYFFSFFLYTFIAYALVKSFKWFGYIILLVYMFVGFHFLRFQIDHWRQGGDVVKSLIRDYKWADNPGKVHILTLGDNLDGVYLFRNDHDSSFFSEYYEVMNKKECTPLQQYTTMTMTSENDSVNANVINDSTIQVNLLTGGWFMNNGLGAVDYKTTDASIKLNKQQPSSFQITFKNKKPGDVYIYESGLHWKQVNGF